MTREEIMQLNTDYLNGCESEHKMNELFSYVLEQQPCDDAISRDAVCNIVDDIRGCISVEGYWAILERLQKLPPVNPQSKTGYWIVDGSVDCYLDKVRCHCSECGKKKEFPADYDHIKHKLSISYQYPEFIDNYCPNCGCHMVEEQERSDKE